MSNEHESEKITCKICGSTLLQMTASHLKKHGLTVSEYKEEFDPNVKISWSRGLTKETDERVEQQSKSLKKTYQSGFIDERMIELPKEILLQKYVQEKKFVTEICKDLGVSWRILKRELKRHNIPERSRSETEKLKNTRNPRLVLKRTRYGKEHGRWGKTHTEEAKQALREHRLGKEMSEDTKKKLSRVNIEKTSLHARTIIKHKEILEEQGYKVIPIHGYKMPDLIAVSGENLKAYAVEIEISPRGIDYNKYVDSKCYNDIIWVIADGKDKNE